MITIKHFYTIKVVIDVKKINFKSFRLIEVLLYNIHRYMYI
jgi:hypothetical protein